MKKFFFHPLLRLMILAIGVSLLSVDSWAYYQTRPLVTPKTPAGLQSEVLPTPVVTPTPTTAFTDQPATTALTNLPTAEFNVRELKLVRTLDSAQIAAAQTAFLNAPIPTSVDQVSIYQLDYDIRGRDGTWKPIVAKVFVPTTPSPTHYPLLVFGSGTTGVADKCAPTLENVAVENLGNYDNHLISQSAAGYVTVFPDYEGYHDPAAEAYFIAESEAKVLLGAIKSLLELQPTTATLQVADLETVILGGFSQGGHAAQSAAAAWSQLPTTIKLKGIVEYAGAANLEALFLDSPWLAGYLTTSLSSYYGNELDPRLILQDRWLISLAEKNEALCVNATYRFYPHDPSKIYNPAFLDALQTQVWPATLAIWKQAIELNTPMTDLPNVPILLAQGETDPIVTPQTQLQNLKRLCSLNHHVNYRNYPDVNHFQIRQASFVESNEWLRQVLADQPPQSDCQ